VCYYADVSMQPVIIPRSSHTISRKWISPHALRVLYRLKEQGYLAYLVGGSVRDLLLGREPKDFDIATDATPNEVKKTFRNCRLIGRRFRLAHIHFHDEIIEVATFRALASEAPEEETVPDLVHPSEALPTAGQPGFQKILPSSAATGGESRVSVPEPVSPPVQTARAAVKTRAPRLLKTEDGMILRDNVWGTPEEDALRRDFTVNALFYNIADFSVIDYVGGMEDLRRGLIRIIGDPEVRFTEDPVRMVRAVRFAAMLGFEVEEQTLRALLDMKERVALASPSRMYEEVQKLLLLGEGEKIFQMLRKTGLFGVIFPAYPRRQSARMGGRVRPRGEKGRAAGPVRSHVRAIHRGEGSGIQKSRRCAARGPGQGRCRVPGRARAEGADPAEGRAGRTGHHLEPDALRKDRRESSLLFYPASGICRCLRVSSVHQ
jgi:poly(A) polymerase